MKSDPNLFQTEELSLHPLLWLELVTQFTTIIHSEDRHLQENLQSFMIILSVPQFLPSYLSLATNVFLLGIGLMFCLLAQLQNGCIKNEPNKLLEKYSFLFLGLRKDSLPFSRVNNSTIHAMTGSKSVLTVSRVRNMNETEVQGQAASACLDFRRRHKILSAQVMTFLY